MHLSQTPVELRFWSKVSKTKQCWEWQGAKRRGYGAIWKGGRHGRHYPAHRIAWELTMGPIPENAMILHHCDNKMCVRPEHLYIGSHDDNMKDAVDRERMCQGDAHREIHKNHIKNISGEKSPRASLNNQQAYTIREMYDTGKFSFNELARHFSVSKRTIHRIIHKITYKQ